MVFGRYNYNAHGFKCVYAGMNKHRVIMRLTMWLIMWFVSIYNGAMWFYPLISGISKFMGDFGDSHAGASSVSDVHCQSRAHRLKMRWASSLVIYPLVIKDGKLENPRAEWKFLSRKITFLNDQFFSKLCLMKPESTKLKYQLFQWTSPTPSPFKIM